MIGPSIGFSMAGRVNSANRTATVPLRERRFRSRLEAHAQAHDFDDLGKEHFGFVRLCGAKRSPEGVEDSWQEALLDEEPHLDLEREVDDVVRSPKYLAPATGRIDDLHLGQGHAVDADGGEGFPDLVELGRGQKDLYASHRMTLHRGEHSLAIAR